MDALRVVSEIDSTLKSKHLEIKHSISTFFRMRFQLISDVNGKYKTHNILSTDHPEVIEISTKNGIHKLDNPKPTLPDNLYCKGKGFYAHQCDDFPPIWTYRCDCKTGYSCGYGEKFNPLTKTWTDRSGSVILVQIFYWAMKQPPEPDFEGAEKDRESVEVTFQELDKSIPEKPVVSK